MDVMMAASKVVPQFVTSRTPEQRDGKGQAGEKRGRVAIDEPEGFEESVKRCSLIVRIGGGEMRSGEQGK